MEPTLTPSVWVEIARQVPAVLAFLVIVMIINRNYIAQNSTIINSFLGHLQKQDEGDKKAMKEIANSLEAMGVSIVKRLDEHDNCVEGKVISAIQKERTMQAYGTTVTQTTITKRNRRTKAQVQEDKDQLNQENTE